jgi:hypothetical protein
MKEFSSVVTLSFHGNFCEANTKEEYIERVKVIFFEEYGFKLLDSEITEINEINEVQP